MHLMPYPFANERGGGTKRVYIILLMTLGLKPPSGLDSTLL